MKRCPCLTVGTSGGLGDQRKELLKDNEMTASGVEAQSFPNAAPVTLQRRVFYRHTHTHTYTCTGHTYKTHTHTTEHGTGINIPKKNHLVQIASEG